MSYRFIEMNNLTDNPNIDLDFGNNILYKELIDDDLDTHNIVYNTGDVKATHSNKSRNIVKKRQQDTRNIYILFIVVIIMLLIFWYVGRHKTENETNIVDRYISDTDLVVLQPRLHI